MPLYAPLKCLVLLDILPELRVLLNAHFGAGIEFIVAA